MFLSIIFFSHFIASAFQKDSPADGSQAFSLACHRSSGLWQLRIPSDASGLQNYNREKLRPEFPSPSTVFFWKFGIHLEPQQQKTSNSRFF